ncbi:MAG: molecular chaperone GrpE [Verrucomicrobiales bacterium]|jgi:molecular chaperone GrpE
MEEQNTTTDAPAPDLEEAIPFPADEQAADTDPSSEAEGGSEPEPLDPITALTNEVAEWKDHALRARADLDNYRKRMAAEKSESIRYANQSLFESLLPVLDNFHFGLDAARNATDSQGVLMGMEMVLKQFQDFLQNQNITPVPADPGSVFDPNLHEAVAQEHDPEVPDGAILKVIRSGYRMGERLVRASNVVVSKGPKA